MDALLTGCILFLGVGLELTASEASEASEATENSENSERSNREKRSLPDGGSDLRY